MLSILQIHLHIWYKYPAILFVY